MDRKNAQKRDVIYLLWPWPRLGSRSLQIFFQWALYCWIMSQIEVREEKICSQLGFYTKIWFNWPLTKNLGSRPLHIHLPQALLGLVNFIFFLIVTWKLIVLLYLVSYFKVLYFFLQCGYPHCFDRILLVLKIKNRERVYSKVHHIEIFCFMDSNL